ncbi:hypothetical protein KYB31_05540 [Clostridium felsineum]|uniref:hypothetical protein n=1 Tax=Clostridium felsineum TaxID=36839 RepID=UPI00214D6C0F|nr:hypothetical protein [Clostridium felsineum]MCR3758458.1 hypothetical protein [Clostridium felsineum]
MSKLFRNHSYLSQILKHRELPIYKTHEFDFFRCVNVGNWVYGKTISKLHEGNLRMNDNKGRYSKLFPNEKISYWADSKVTALAEIKKHKGNKNYLTFCAYDDSSSTFPILDNDEDLIIIDGIDFNFHKILLKIEQDEELTIEEIELVKLIKKEKPDCLAYKSVANNKGTNFLFFEKGFKKLSLRETSLYFGEKKNKNTKTISCVISGDYSPIIENYGKYFEPIVREKMDSKYKYTEAYNTHLMNYKKSLNRLRESN